MNDPKIFFDPSGKRQYIMAALTLAVIVFLTVCAFVIIPKIFSNPAPVTYYSSLVGTATMASSLDELGEKSRDALINELRSQNLTVLGEGPLVRIVRLQTDDGLRQAVDMQTKHVTRTLDVTESQQVDGQSYAIERYGASNTKRIALTFDDGPDPKYSPLVLDELSRQGIPATFFVTGKNVIQEGEIARRMAQEGHVLANHTFSHVNVNVVGENVARQEIILTQRAIRSATGYETSFFRIPYSGSNDQSMRDNVRAIVVAQMLGYIVASYDFDTNDWNIAKNTNIPLPDLSGNNDIVMLLHDAGGDRTNTIEYVKKLAAAAKKSGYTFANMSQLYTQEKPLFAPVAATVEDQVTHTTSQALYVWPLGILKLLFAMTVFSVLFALLINTLLAFLQNKKTSYKRRKRNYYPLATVLVPAYNESMVIKRTVSSLLKSSYRNLEIIVINDGSTDTTRQVAQALARKSKRVRSVSQRNAGKATALNNGIKKAKGEIIICVDADTLFPAYTVTRLVRHFSDPRVGAVAGSVKVGNISNFVTRWQALEYTVSIHLERTAQAFLHSVVIVPGACGAWRKKAVLQAGGYSHSTLAEDCDLTLSVHKAGFQVLQDNTAVGFTEAPDRLGLLAKQRFRWIFGNMQSFWKHRRLLLDPSYGWLGMFVMPYAVFNIVIPILFIPTLTLLAAINIANGQYMTLLLFATITMLIQAAAATIAVIFAKERFSLLLAVPFTRIVYSPLKTYLLYKSVITIVRGSQVNWNKFGRTGAVGNLILLQRQWKKTHPAT